jgi:hypothetical protein
LVVGEAGVADREGQDTSSRGFFSAFSAISAVNGFPDEVRRTTYDEVQYPILMSSRTFTLDEAQDLLPVLESLLRTAIEAKQLIEAVEEEFQALSHQVFIRGGMSLNIVHLASRKAQRDKALQRIKDAMAEIDAIGVQVKDLDIGLLDFPCEVDGQVILLCWKLGEKAVTHWHGVSEGFAGRKPVDERITKAKRAN